MRARNIKPGFFKNEVVASLQPSARVLLIGLWCYADKKGRLEWRPRRIKAEILPYENKNINTLLNELVKAGFLIRYSVNGEEYAQVANFEKHQHPHHTEKDSEIPSPLDNGAVTVNPPLNNRRTPSDSLIPDSLIQEKGDVTVKDSTKKSKTEMTWKELENEFPPWLDRKVWDEFRSIRKQKKAACTPYAEHLLLLTLQDLAKAGHDPRKVIEQSIRKSWKDLFPLQQNGSDSPPTQTPSNRLTCPHCRIILRKSEVKNNQCPGCGGKL